MATIVNTVLGENKGKKRVWLEGQKLKSEGYEPGMRYDLELKDSQVLLKATDSGKFIISKRERNGRVHPIIDISTQQLAEIFHGVEKLRVLIKQGTIVITAHHQQERVVERVERLMDKIANREPLSVCSLFHGGGILEKALHHGLIGQGIKTQLKVAVEMEGKYLDSSRQNNPELWAEEHIAIESPVQDVNLQRGAPSVDLLCGGIPCTGASRSGRAKNKLQYAESHEAAGAMFFHFLRFVEVLNPAIVLIENVAEYANTSSMVVIRSVLNSLGYYIEEKVLEGNEFGALESRKRLCVIALSNGLEGFSLDNAVPVKVKEPALSCVLDEIPDDSQRWKTFSYLAEKEKKDKAAGKGFTRQLLTGDEAFCGTIGRGYSKCRSTEPFILNKNNQELSRILTPAEHCRVKGIPESTVEGLGDTVAHEILGQSVIFPVFEAVGKALGKHLDLASIMKPMINETHTAAPFKLCA